MDELPEQKTPRDRRSKMRRLSNERRAARELQAGQERDSLAELTVALRERCVELGMTLTGDGSVGLGGFAAKDHVLCLGDGFEINLRLVGSAAVAMLVEQLSADLAALRTYVGICQPRKGQVEILIEDVAAKSKRFPAGTYYYSMPATFFPSAEDRLRRRSARIYGATSVDGLEVEISEPSFLFEVVHSRFLTIRDHFMGLDNPYTLKISGLALQDVDHAERVLERLARSLSFYLEARFNCGFALSVSDVADGYEHTGRAEREAVELENIDQPLTVKLNSYETDAVSYYWHAKQAESVPLAAYIGYYQVLEYHFRRYMNQESIRLVQRWVRDPRRDPENDHDVANLIAVLGKQISAANSEERQLRVTLEACVDPGDLARFIEDDSDLAKHLRKGELPGIPALSQRDTGPELVERAAERIYRLRCQIVHSKGDSRRGEVFLLVPGSPAASAVREEIKLVRYLAQTVIIASSQTLNTSDLA